MGLPLQRHIGQMAYPAAGAGAPTTMELPRTALWRNLLLQLFGTKTDSGSEAGTSFLEGDARLIREISVIANGSNTLKRYSGATLRALNFNDNFGTYGNQTANGVATAEVDTEWFVPFAMPHGIHPLDTCLSAGRFSLLELRVVWGTTADWVSSPSGGNWSYADLVLAVGIEELVLAPGQTVNPGIFLETPISHTFTATGGIQQIQLPIGDFYRSLFIKNTVSDEKDDTGILYLHLRSGATRFVDRMGWGDTGAAVALQGLERTHNWRQRHLVPIPGYRHLEFCYDNMLSEMLATASLEELILEPELAPATTCTIETTVRSVVNPAFLRG